MHGRFYVSMPFEISPQYFIIMPSTLVKLRRLIALDLSIPTDVCIALDKVLFSSKKY